MRSASKATRNFFVDASFDDWRGTKRKRWGPVATKDGAFTMTIYMLREGRREVAIEIKGKTFQEGGLMLSASSPVLGGAGITVNGSRAKPRERFWRAKRRGASS